MLLSKMKKISEDYLHKDILNSVIIVLTYFNNSQKQATINEGRITGLNILRTLNKYIVTVITND